MDERRKILFLDIDGVLNCHQSKTYWSPEHPETYGIDDNCWNRLQEFLKSNPNVVIHSSWAKAKDVPDAKWDMGTGDPNIFIKSPLPDVVKRLGKSLIGYVPNIKGKNKFSLILAWLSDNGFDPIHIEDKNVTVAVLDDQDDMWTNLRQLRNFPCIYVRFTNNQLGLQNEDVDYIQKAFDGKDVPQ